MNEHTLSHLAMTNINAICYIADLETYDLIYLNESAKKMVIDKSIDVIGRKCYEILQGKTEVCNFCTNNKLSKGKSYKWEFFNPMLNKYFELIDTIVEIEGKDVRMEFAFDITDSKNKLTKLKTRLTFEETLLKCAQALSEEKNTELAINKLLEIICLFFEADRSYIFEIHDDNIHISNTYEWNNKGAEPQIENLQMLDKEDIASWFELFEKKEDFIVNLADDAFNIDSKIYKMLEALGISSLIAAPLTIDNQFLGFLGVDNPRMNTIDKALLRSVTLFVISELEKKGINEKLRRSSYIDSFTGIYNRNKYIKSIDKIIANIPESVGIIYLDIDGLKKANDKYGHEYGDKIILKLVNLLKTYFPYDLFRIGGDEFIGLYYGNNQSHFNEKISHLQKAIDDENDISVSMGSSWCVDTQRIAEKIVQADEIMYLNKQNHYTLKNVKNKCN